jgi:signal transduction histidine kinase
VDNITQLWVGTANSGANRLDVEHQRFYKYLHDNKQLSSIADNQVNAIYQTGDGVMWFATPKSLDKLDYISGDFVHYKLTEGLANKNIKALTQDDFGDLWLSSNKGISQLKRETETFHNFYAQEEIGNNNFLPNVVLKSKKGALYFGGTNGISEVTPSQVITGSMPPIAVITNIWVDNQRLASYDYPEHEPLVLNHQTKSIQLQFAALDYHRPYENKYSYMLEGFDENWHDPQSARTASYTSLNPGRYVFKVKGSNSRGHWSEIPAQLEIIVYPPWWQIWWVRVLIVLTVVALIYFITVFRLSRIAKKEKWLEQQVALRIGELDERNEQLASTIERLSDSQKELVEKEKMASLGQMVAGIAHEVNTPLGMGITASTLLHQRIEDIKALFEAKKLKPAQFSKFLEDGIQNTDIIFRNLERAADLVNSFKQVAVDQSSEHDRSFNLAQIFDETLLSLSPKLQGVQHKVEVYCAKDINLYSRPGPLTQVIINLIMNSVKHAFAEDEIGLISIEVVVVEQNCTVIYRDSGCGVPEAIQSTVFDPFVTTKRGDGCTGLGMHLVYNIITQALNGNVALNSTPGKGIEVSFTIPMDIRQDCV